MTKSDEGGIRKPADDGMGAGPTTIRGRSFLGLTTRAPLFRIFITLTIIVVVSEGILSLISTWYPLSDVFLHGLTLGIVIILASLVIYWVSKEQRSALDSAERELKRKNEELHSVNEELAATVKNLYRNVDQLTRKEKELNIAEERLLNHINSSPLAVIEFDARFVITRWSEEAVRMFGWTREEILGKAIGEFRWVHEDDAERFLAISTAILNGKSLRNMHSFRNYRKDGTIIECEWYNSALRDDKGNLVSVFSQVLDVTLRKKAENRDRFQATLLATISDAIIAFDMEFRVTSWNAAAERMYGWTAEEALGKTPVALGLLKAQQQLLDLRHELRGGTIVRSEQVHYNQNGSPIWVEAITLELRGQDYRTAGYVTVNRDITPRKTAEEALWISERTATAILSAVQESICLIDADGRILQANAATIKQLGRQQPSEVIGHSFYAFLPPENAYESRIHLAEVIATGKPVRFEDEPGGLTFDHSFFPVFDETGRATRIAIFTQDISERTILEEETQSLLATVVKEKNRLTALISSINDEIWFADITKIFTLANPAALREFGLSPDTNIGVESLAAVSGALRPDGSPRPVGDAPPLRALNGEVVKDEIEIVRTPFRNEQRYRLVSSFPVRDTAEAIIGSVTVVRDITERMQAEATLRESERREQLRVGELETILDTTPAIVFITHDREGDLMTGNLATCRLLGIPRGEPVHGDPGDPNNTQRFRFVKNGLELPAGQMPVQLAAHGHHVHDFEFDLVFDDGTSRTLFGNAEPLPDESGEPQGAIGIFIDITEIRQMDAAFSDEITHRRQAELNVKKALSQLNAALESTADGIYVISLAGKITGYNQNFAAMWNIPGDLLESGDNLRVSDYLSTLVVRPEIFREENGEIRHHKDRESYDMLELRDGRIFERYSKPQRLEKTIVGRVWSFRDVTDRRRAEQGLLASLKEKETLIREIHHRVKNNLQIISGLLDMTRMRSKDPTTVGILTDMMMKIKTMAQIHTRLYESKQFNKINMGGQIRDQITDLSAIYGRSGAEITSEIEVRDMYLPVDQAIPCALIVNEILSNVFKHAFKGRMQGAIRVTAGQDEDIVSIAILDNGVGIPADVDVNHATSLGFKLIRSLVMQLSGTVVINSSPQGSEVIVEFPFRVPEK